MRHWARDPAIPSDTEPSAPGPGRPHLLTKPRVLTFSSATSARIERIERVERQPAIAFSRPASRARRLHSGNGVRLLQEATMSSMKDRAEFDRRDFVRLAGGAAAATGLAWIGLD